MLHNLQQTMSILVDNEKIAMKKEVRVVVFPSVEKTEIFINNDGDYFFNPDDTVGLMPVDLIVLSNDPITVSSTWFDAKDCSINGSAFGSANLWKIAKDEMSCKKIIGTTKQSLFLASESIQKLDRQSMVEFINNPTGKIVVEYEEVAVKGLNGLKLFVN